MTKKNGLPYEKSFNFKKIVYFFQIFFLFIKKIKICCRKYTFIKKQHNK